MDFTTIVFTGHVVADPQLRRGRNGKSFGSFRIAVNQWYGGQETAAFYSCMTSEEVYAAMHKAGVAKGSYLSLTGSLVLHTYCNEAGQEKTGADVRVLDWHYCGSTHKTSAPAPANAPAAWQNGTKTAPAPSAGSRPDGTQDFTELSEDGEELPV